jgi:eukaryotic-like serine/threonine-protein kinase
MMKIVSPPPMSKPSVEASPSIGKYRRIAELGRGGMATVYLCVTQGPAGFNKLHVIKCLRADLAADGDAQKMFLEEARISARLGHPNIVQTYEVGHDGQFPFITMEYVEGQTLEKLVRRARKQAGELIPLPIHLEILVQVLAGLHFAHELADFDGAPLRLVHRDVSPQNVMVTYEGHVKVLDFGIAKVADSSEETKAGIMKGKLSYMAPEQCVGAPADRRADIYAVGVMLWQAITGHRMWQGVTGTQVLAKVLAGEIPRPQDVEPNVDPALAAVCMKALAVEPSDRYSSAAELQSVLEDYLGRNSNRPGSRELGQYVRNLGQDSRARIRAAIEHELKKSTPETSIIDISTLGGSEASNSGVRSASEPSTGGAAVKSPNARKPSKLLIGAGVAGALAFTAILATMLSRGSPGAGAQVVTQPAASQQPETPAMPGPKLVVLKVSATPPEAKLFFDDNQLGSNPATLRLPRDGAAHRVSARATGYETKSQLVTFDSETASADIVLEPVGRSFAPQSRTPASFGAPPRPVARQATPTPPNPPTPPTNWQEVGGPPTPTARTLDTSSPWSN